MHDAAIGAVRRYLAENGDRLDRTVHSELKVQVHVAPGITVDGRIDLIRYVDTGELAIADFKSTERAQAEDITRAQLHTYVVGYEELSGDRADLVEILNLDERSRTSAKSWTTRCSWESGPAFMTPERRFGRTTSPAFDVVRKLRQLRSCRHLPRPRHLTPVQQKSPWSVAQVDDAGTEVVFFGQGEVEARWPSGKIGCLRLRLWGYEQVVCVYQARLYCVGG